MRLLPARIVAAIALPLMLGLFAAAQAEVVLVVSRDNPTPDLSANDVANLYLGRSRRFPDGREAIVLDQPEGSAARESFYRSFLGRTSAQIKAHWSRLIFTGRGQPPREVAGDAAMRVQVAADPRLIGYVDIAAVDGSVRVVARPPQP